MLLKRARGSRHQPRSEKVFLSISGLCEVRSYAIDLAAAARFWDTPDALKQHLDSSNRRCALRT